MSSWIDTFDTDEEERDPDEDLYEAEVEARTPPLDVSEVIDFGNENRVEMCPLLVDELRHILEE